MTVPTWFAYTFTAVLGLVVGSFLNVVVARLPRGKSLAKPRSQCPNCSRPVGWYDNIPLFSYIFLKGRCRRCHEKISLRYPVIELLTALLFLTALARFEWSPLLFVRDWPFMAILIAVTFIDLEHRLIPNKLSLPGILIGLASAWAVPELGIVSAALGAAFGFGLFYAFAWLYQKTSKRSGLGGGDIKLLAMIGAFVGPSGVFTTVLVSCVLGSIIGLVWAKASKQQSVMATAIPYGPFLAIGGIYAYLLGDVLWLRFMTPM